MVAADDDALFPLPPVEETEAVRKEEPGPVEKSFRPYDPNQILLMPPSLEEWLPERHLARFVSELVEEALDLSAIRAAYTEERGYPCVRVKTLAQDTKAARPAFVDNLKFQMHALYCRHPGRPNTGFSILFSYRGASIDAALDIPAQAFIAGVQPSKN